MGAEFWKYYAPFRGDVDATLEELRQSEFEAGRYHRSELRPSTIQQAMLNAGADGTRSILDMGGISPSPEPMAVSPVPRDTLLAIFKTDRPTRPMVEGAFKSRDATALDDMIEEIGRGEGRHFLIYQDDVPMEVFFCGYSFD